MTNQLRVQEEPAIYNALVKPAISVTRLGQLLTVIRGVTYKKEAAKAAPGDGLVGLLRATNIQQSLSFDELVYVPASCVSETQLLRSGDILVVASSGSRTVVGKAAPLTHSWTGSFGAFCFALRPNANVEPSYLAAFLRSPQYRDRVSDLAAGTNINNLRATHIEETLIPLPERDRQREIVAYLDEQLSRLDASVAALHRVQANLKRYRASVLKSACEGRLVPTETELARQEGRDFETGGQLLQRSLAERQRLGTFNVRGTEAAASELSGLDEPPSGWAWSCGDQALDHIEAGKSFKCEERPPRADEVGVLKVSAVSWGEFDEEESKTCIDEDKIDTRYMVNAGDFLFSRANTIELVGACVIVNSVHRKLMLSDKTLRFSVSSAVLPHWLLYCLRSQLGRDDIERLSTGNQESMRNIGHARIRQIRIPLPPLAEQHRIVAEADRRLSLIRVAEAQVAANLARAQRLRQSILQAAFSG